MNTSLVNPAVCSLNGLLYVFGENFNQVYNPVQNKWEEFSPPETPRVGSRACAFNGKIYIIGGHAGETTNFVECFDTSVKKWCPCPPMIEGRKQPGVAVLSNRIYVCGGENSSGEISNTIEAFDLDKHEWNFVSTMKKERNWLSCTTLRLENSLANPFTDLNNIETDMSMSNSTSSPPPIFD